MAEAILRGRGLKHRMISLPWFICRRLAMLKSWIGGQKVTAEQALAGFLYDAVPSIESAEKDLDYHPKSPFGA